MKQVVVAAAVLWRNDGAVLLGQRAAGTFYAGFWEFPGGKVEGGETPRDALIRELAEELGVVLTHARIAPWLVRTHRYEHAEVTLHFFQVWDWEGVPQPFVHAALAWEQPGAWSVSPVLPANAPVLAALALPQRMVVSNVTAASQGAPVGSRAWGEAAERLADAIAAARTHGEVIVQIRERLLGESEYAHSEPWSALGIDRLVCLARDAGAKRVVVNGPLEWALAAAADGCHLSAERARVLCSSSSEWRREGLLVGVSVHDIEERAVAEALAADYWVVGPVAPTATHPAATPLGWSRFAALIAHPPVPVFAIGGLAEENLTVAQAHGAHGIAAIRGWRSASV